jgi:hypothetical protein
VGADYQGRGGRGHCCLLSLCSPDKATLSTAPGSRFEESGPVYLLPTGPVSSFLVISDPAAAKHVLRSTDNSNRNIYGKGLVAEVQSMSGVFESTLTCIRLESAGSHECMDVQQTPLP